MSRPVLIAHAAGDEEIAQRLAAPIAAMGYDVVHGGTVLIGDSLIQEATKVLIAGGPVVLCGTVRAMGTGWAHRVVNAARSYAGVKIYGVQVDQEAYLDYLTLDSEVARFWHDADRAIAALVTAITTHYPLGTAAQSSNQLAQSHAEQRFRDILLSTCDIIDLANLPADRQLATRQLMLRSLFVPLKVRPEHGETEEPDPLLVVPADDRDEPGSPARPVGPKPIAAGPAGRASDDAARVGARLQISRRMVILGDPGAGKTTLLRWIATAYLLRMRADPEWSALPAVDTLPNEDWLPILVRCRDLGPEQVAGAFEDVLVHVLRRAELGSTDVGLLRELITQRLDNGTALLLIDGLDEITDQAARARFCRQLEQVHLARPLAPIIVTSRIVGYRETGYRIGRGFEHLTIAPLSRSDKDDFLRRWCAITEPPNRQQTAAAEVIADIHSNDRIERLTSNPMLLTTMALVRRKVGKLPEHRADLYREAVQVLLNWRAEVDEPIDHHEAVPQLEYLAYAMCDQGVQQLTDDSILELLERMRVEYPSVHAIHRRSAADFVRLLERRTGILVESGQVRRPGRLASVFEFRHLTFQEYLAALALVEGKFPGRDRANSLAHDLGALAGRLGEAAGGAEPSVSDNWQEAIRLCVTICNDDDVDAVLEAVLTPGNDDAANTATARAMLAARCLEDEPNAGQPIVERILDGLVERATRPGDTADASEIVLRLAKSPWATQLVAKLTNALHAGGVHAVPRLGNLLGETVAQAAPTAKAELAAWQTAHVVSLNDSSPDSRLQAVCCIGFLASRDIIRWSAAADDLVDIARSEEAILAGASAWALACMRDSNAAVAWHPSDHQIEGMREAAARPEIDATRLISLTRAMGLRDLVVSLPWLVEASTTEDPLIRAAAVRGLGESGDETAVEPLLHRLDDESPDVREATAKALGDLGFGQVVNPLIRVLVDPSTAVRTAAAYALGTITDIGALHSLVVALDDAEADVRNAALWSLGQLRDGRALDAIRARMPDSLDSNGSVIWSLAEISGSSAVPQLLEHLEDERTTVRSWAAYALSWLNDRRAFGALLAHLTDSSESVRASCARALGRLEDVRAIDSIASLLDDEDSDVRAAACAALGDLGDQRVLPLLMRAFADIDSDVRSEAVEAVGQLITDLARDDLVALLADDSVRVAASATGALGRLQDGTTLTAMVGALDHDHSHVRSRAAEGLRRLADHRAVTPLTDRLTDPVAEVRAQAAWALGGLDDNRCLPALRARLADPHSWVRSSAGAALGRLRDVDSIPSLLSLLESSTLSERKHAADALGALETDSVAAALIATVADSHGETRSWVAYALGKLDAGVAGEGIARLLEDPCPRVRIDATRAVATCQAVALLPRVMSTLSDPHPLVRAEAVTTVGMLGAHEASDMVLRALTDPHHDVRAAASWSLGYLDMGSAVHALIDALDDPNRHVVAGAAWALGQSGDPAAFTALEAMTDHPIAGIRLRVVDALTVLDSARAVPMILAAIADPDKDVRRQAAACLRHCRDDSSLNALSASLSDDAREVRAAAAQTLGYLGNPLAAPALVARLADRAAGVRAQAARALGFLGEQNAAGRLRQNVDDPDLLVSGYAVWSLARLGDTSALPGIRERMSSAVSDCRQELIAILDSLADPAARQEMGHRLTSGSAWIRRSWMGAFANALPDVVDMHLLARDVDAVWPWLDSQAVVDERRVRHAARVLRLDPGTVRERYHVLAQRLPLTLRFESALQDQPGSPSDPRS